MLNLATQRHITHVILVDCEPASVLRELSHNAEELYQQFCQIFHVPCCDCYTLVLAFLKDRTDLEAVAEEARSHMESIGSKCTISSISDADMVLTKGKAGLLSCTLWAVAGAVLLNDRPIPLDSAGFILQTANTETPVQVLDEGFHIAVLGSSKNLSPSLLHLPEMHSLGDILRSLSSPSCDGQTRRWWQFWK